MPELDEEELLELRILLRHTVATNPYPLSPRVRRLRAILDKLDPQPARPQPHPAPKPAGEPSYCWRRSGGGEAFIPVPHCETNSWTIAECDFEGHSNGVEEYD
jgi:hypothetical protein